ncbi:MAG: DUF4861 domain-containing protein [Mariniphaga sp.]|nr:DUF4861 domain-containing protein [Mariniphaga sp.]
MKLKIFCILLLAVFLFSCKKEVEIFLTNSLNVERIDEVLILSRNEIASKIKLTEGLLPVFEKEDDIFIPSQVDDLNNDGTWDEVVLVLNFDANETLELKIDFVKSEDYPEFEKRTNLRLGIHQEDGTYKEVDQYLAPGCDDGFKIIAQGESVNWENDKIGFRNYFDCRNVKDLFGKLKPGFIIDKLHTPELGDYHSLSDWGMDVLHCGSSLGSGGIALLRNDSLFRLGSTNVYEYQKILEGPLRSVFELRYEGWKVDDDELEAVERISLYPGKYWFESDVTIIGCLENDQIVTGIVTTHLKNEPFEFDTNDFKCIGTHDVQSLNNDELGMAVLVPSGEAGKIERTTDINFFNLGYQTVVEKSFSNIISETYYIGQECEDRIPAKHYFFSVWGLDKEQWKTEEGFRSYIESEALKLSNSILLYN